MRKKSHLSLGDVPEDLPVCDGACFPGGGLCCPDDPLELVLHFLAAPAPAPHQVSLAALGIGGSPRRQEQTGAGWGQEKDAPAGGGGVLEQEYCGLSLRAPEDLEALDKLDIDMYFADNAPDGGGDAAPVCNQPCHTAAMPSSGVRGALGGVVPNGAPPLPPPLSMDAPHPHAAPPLLPPMSPGVLHPYAAPPLTPPMSAGVLNPYACRGFGGVSSSDVPPLRAPMPAGGGLQPWGAPIGVVSNDAPPLPAPMPAGGGLHPCGALVHVVSGDAPPSRAHTPPSARTLPASCTSSGSTTSEEAAPPWHPLPWVVLRKRRRSPMNCRKRPWSLDFPLHALVVAPPDHPSDIIGGVDGKNSCDNTGGGGIRRRRPVPRQRNRQAQRVCSHCHSPDTPQWRAGPDGPGTLCNACGIRYAANKLLPEYRPSTAPSFRSDQHSNRHRKVVKLREQKAKETLKADPMQVPASPKSDEFMDVCTYISTGL